MTPSLIIKRRIVLTPRSRLAFATLVPPATHAAPAAFGGIRVVAIATSLHAVDAMTGADLAAAEGGGAAAALGTFLTFGGALFGCECCHD